MCLNSYSKCGVSHDLNASLEFLDVHLKQENQICAHTHPHTLSPSMWVSLFPTEPGTIICYLPHPNDTPALSRPSLSPVDTGLGRNMPLGRSVSSAPCGNLLSSLGCGLHAGTVVSSAERGRQSPMPDLDLEGWNTGSQLPSEGDRRSLQTDAHEVDREQEPASLSS